MPSPTGLREAFSYHFIVWRCCRHLVRGFTRAGAVKRSVELMETMLSEEVEPDLQSPLVNRSFFSILL